MLFSTLDTLKRKMVMGIIFFLFTGLTMFVVPEDYIPVVGAMMQEYLGGRIDREELAQELTEYWKGASVIEH